MPWARWSGKEGAGGAGRVGKGNTANFTRVGCASPSLTAVYSRPVSACSTLSILAG